MEQTEVRNFRALDAASNRLKTVIANLHQIASNVPVGVPSSSFEEILESTRGRSLLNEQEIEYLEATGERIEREIEELDNRYEAARRDPAAKVPFTRLTGSFEEDGRTERHQEPARRGLSR